MKLLWLRLTVAFLAAVFCFSLFAKRGDDYTPVTVKTNFNGGSFTMPRGDYNCITSLKEYDMAGDNVEFRTRRSSGGGWFSNLFSGWGRKRAEPRDNDELEMYVNSNKLTDYEHPVAVITPDGKLIKVKIDGNGNNCNIVGKPYASAEAYMETVWTSKEYKKDFNEKYEKLQPVQKRHLQKRCRDGDSRTSASRGVRGKGNPPGGEGGERSNDRGNGPPGDGKGPEGGRGNGAGAGSRGET